MKAIITVDSREPAHIQGLQWEDCYVSVATLEHGDFSIVLPDGTLILIERKTPRDLLDSIKDGRLFNQISGLVSKTKWAYLLIEGDLWDEASSTAWNWSSIQGVLLSVQELGCAILYDADTHGAIERLMNRSRNDVKVAPRREPYIFNERERILMSIDGIGSKKAQEFLVLFNDNIALALTALTAEHDGKKNHITGWGKKSRDNLVELLGGQLEIKL